MKTSDLQHAGNRDSWSQDPVEQRCAPSGRSRCGCKELSSLVSYEEQASIWMKFVVPPRIAYLFQSFRVGITQMVWIAASSVLAPLQPTALAAHSNIKEVITHYANARHALASSHSIHTMSFCVVPGYDFASRESDKALDRSFERV